MPASIPQLSRAPKAFIVSLVFLIALSASLLPAAADNPPGRLGPDKSDHWQETVSTTPAADEPQSPAAAFVVNDNGDAPDTSFGNGVCDTSPAAGDQCTLRAAIQEANSNFGSHTIGFSLPPSSTITLNTALPDIFSTLTMTGPGSNLLTVTRSTAGGTPNFRIFKINGIQSVSISGLTITNGRSADGLPNGGFAPGYGGQGDSGGGIYSAGALTLSDVVVTGNRTGDGGTGTSGSGGFGGFGGGIYVSNTGTLTMTNVTVSNNTAGNGAVGNFGGSGGRGGGIYFLGSTLTMTNCVVSGNTSGNGVSGTSGGSSGSGGDGGGINAEPPPSLASSTLTLTNVIINGNHAGDGALPISSTGGHGGGMLTFPGVTTTMTNCSVSNNNSGQGGTGFSSQGGLGGGIDNHGPLTMIGCTINGNFTKGPSIGGGSSGGGIFSNNTLTMTDCTVSGNATDLDRGRAGGIYNNGATITLTNCTVTGNLSQTGFESGRGVHTRTGTANIKNTIIAGNGSGGPDVSGAYTSLGNNLIGATDFDSTGFTNGSNGDQVGTTTTPLDALLGPLADNGGPTLTHALLAGSTAIDAGNNAFVVNPPFIGPPFTDQRGPGFNRIVDGPDGDMTATVDIGAYEKQPTFPDLPNVSGNEDTTIALGFELADSGSVESVFATSSNTTLVPNSPSSIGVAGSGASRTAIMIPAANRSGTSDITVTVNRTSGSSQTTFTLTVNPVNDAPSFTKGADQTVNENGGAQSVTNWATGISAGAADESGQALTFNVAGNTNAALFAVAPAISSSGTLTYTPAVGMAGSAMITIALMDNGGTSNGGVDTSAQQTFNINVSDGGSLQFTLTSYSVNEATATVDISVFRGGGTAGEARVDYATNDGSAIAGQDYTATSGTLIFPNGVTTKSFTVSILNDALDETTETVGLKLTNAAGTGSLGFQNSVSLFINDDEPTPSLRINDASVVEGDSGTVNAVFTVTLSAASSFNVTANYATADNSASNSSDYQPVFGQVMLSPGELTKTISVTVNGDTTPEGNETFFVNLSNATAAFFTDSQGLGTILSDDAPGGQIKFSSANYGAAEDAGKHVIVVERTGNSSAAATVDYATSDGTASQSPCSTVAGLAAARCDFTQAGGTLRFAAGETSKSITLLINRDNFIEGPETFRIVLGNLTGGAVFGETTTTIFSTFTIADVTTTVDPSPIDNPANFVRLHYHDFLNREADADGLAFWTNQIISCGTDAACIELRRINVSAAFYLSIEFQETGYLVERMYKVSYGNALGTSTLGGTTHQIPVPIVRLNEFLPDTQEIGQGVVVGAPNWEQTLENNKQLFTERFVQRARFTAPSAFPPSLTDSQFVDKLNSNAGGVLLPDERIQLINQLSTGARTRAQVVRIIAEDPDLVIAEKNRAFVLMQYFGYLRRNPNDLPDGNYTGYEFWLNKLNQFAGNFVNADMVKAFIVSSEYRERFSQ